MKLKKTSITTAIEKVEEAMKSDNKEEIEKASEALQAGLTPVMEKAQAAAAQAAQGAPEGTAEEAPSNDDDVVDAEFEEVDDKK